MSHLSVGKSQGTLVFLVSGEDDRLRATRIRFPEWVQQAIPKSAFFAQCGPIMVLKAIINKNDLQQNAISHCILWSHRAELNR